MKKQYLYDLNTPYAVDVEGGIIKISKGETLTTYDDGTFVRNSKQFNIRKVHLKKYFVRIWSEEERNRYDRIWEKSVFACMKALLGKRASDGFDTGTDGILNVTYDIPDMAFAYADMVIERLKEREW